MPHLFYPDYFRDPRSWRAALLSLLAWVLPAAVLAQAGSSPPVIIDSPADFYRSLSVFEAEASGGAPPAMRPRGVLRLARDERYLLWVELGEGRLHLLQQQADGGLITRRIIPISIGKNGFGKQVEGDKRTPVGVYRITSFLDDGDLVDFYGLGAYPLNYPNPQDRRERRTGSGIWLHGLPKDVDQRPLLDSDGCVVIDNGSLVDLAGYIDAGVTHVILSEEAPEWQPLSAFDHRSTALEKAFHRWREAWEAIDNDTYLSYYADNFSDFSRNRSEWVSYKRRVNDGKSSIRVQVSNLSFLADPRRPELVTVRYYQQYRSSNYDWDGWKEQLWRQGEHGWQIIYEGNG